jgi:hypothetical protein
LAGIVWSSCLMIVTSFASVLAAGGSSRLSGEASLGVDRPLAPPSCFLSRSFITGGAGQEYFGTDFPPSMVLSNAMARSSHEGRGVEFDCLPPRRFLIPFSTYKYAFHFPGLTAQSATTHIIQDIRCPPVTGNSSFYTGESRDMCNCTADECSVTVPSCQGWSADVGLDGTKTERTF